MDNVLHSQELPLQNLRWNLQGPPTKSLHLMCRTKHNSGAKTKPAREVVHTLCWKALLDFQKDLVLKIASSWQKSARANTFQKHESWCCHMALMDRAANDRLRYLVNEKGYSVVLVSTAWFIENVWCWLDIMNSRHPSQVLSFNQLNKHNTAIAQLDWIVQIFKDIKIGAVWKPIQTGVVMATVSVLAIQEELLKREDFDFLLTSWFSQDSLKILSCMN